MAPYRQNLGATTRHKQRGKRAAEPVAQGKFQPSWESLFQDRCPEWFRDTKSWEPCGGHEEVIRRSPHRHAKAVRARYLRLTILGGEPGLWEFRVY